jgi:hypothetical protein
VTTLIDVFRWISARTGGMPPPALDNTGDEPAAARSLDERKAAREELDRLEVEGETMGVKLAREHERAVEASKAADRAADDARRLADRAKTVRDAYGWGIEVRKSKCRAELSRGASPIIDQTIAEISRHWELARAAGRHIGSRNAPLAPAELDDNRRADENLEGLRRAMGECESLKLEALSDTELAAALERIIAAIPSRYPAHEPIAIGPKANGSTRARMAHSARAA